ncbi:unnamed protein product [Arctogadus glacialis]
MTLLVQPGADKMWFDRKPVLFLAVLVLALVPAGRCQEDESRRSVTEHQLLHDRGRSIQSLRRLIWLSSAMEGLHTAQPRSAPLIPPKALRLGLGPSLGPGLGARLGGSPQSVGSNGQYRAARDNLLTDFFNPYLMPLPERVP